MLGNAAIAFGEADFIPSDNAYVFLRDFKEKTTYVDWERLTKRDSFKIDSYEKEKRGSKWRNETVTQNKASWETPHLKRMEDRCSTMKADPGLMGT